MAMASFSELCSIVADAFVEVERSLQVNFQIIGSRSNLSTFDP